MDDHLTTTRSSTASSCTFSIVEKWIKTCDETHDECKSATADPEPVKYNPNELPTRLLDLGIHPTSYPKLIDVKDLRDKPKYITLSHCWGKHLPLTLTTGYLRQIRESIDPVTLPSTFKDAVDITRRLGARFLWIDSLCIFQDSVEDWAIESAKMDQIYEQAWCNIAATKAEDTRGGCYSDRVLADVSPLLIELPNFPPETKHLVYDDYSWQKNIEDSRLLNRGWVVQEQLLSVRTVYFARDQVFWRCEQLRACETLPEGEPLEAALGFTIITWQDGHDILRTGSPTDSDFDLERIYAWYRLIQKYTSCQLSMPEKDKLTAISGLARRYGHGVNYLAGLWRSFLPWQLLWAPDHRYEVPHASLFRRSPSWSWVSTDYLVINHIAARIAQGDPWINIHRAETTLAGPDPFGQISEGVIRISCNIAHIETILSCEQETSDREKLIRWLSGTQDDFGTMPDGSMAFYISVLHSPGLRNNSEMTGLWIEPTGRKPGEYRRRGVFKTYQYDPFNEFVPFLKAKLGTEAYQEYQGTNKKGFHTYTITLV